MTPKFPVEIPGNFPFPLSALRKFWKFPFVAPFRPRKDREKIDLDPCKYGYDPCYFYKLLDDKTRYVESLIPLGKCLDAT